MSVTQPPQPSLFDREAVIKLIVLMQTLDKDYARLVYQRENKNHPEWNLFEGIKQELNK